MPWREEQVVDLGLSLPVGAAVPHLDAPELEDGALALLDGARRDRVDAWS